MADMEIDAPSFIKTLSHRLGEMAAEVELMKMMNANAGNRADTAEALVASLSNVVQALEEQVTALGAVPVSQT